jgi:hypothetical protein
MCVLVVASYCTISLLPGAYFGEKQIRPYGKNFCICPKYVFTTAMNGKIDIEWPMAILKINLREIYR